MAITPLPGTLGVAAAAPIPADTDRIGIEGRSGSSATPTKLPVAQPDPKSDPKLKELKAISTRAGLEVRLEMLADSNVTLIRIVDPATGHVVREFPPEGLAKALAEMRAHATARLNRRAIDRRA